MSEEYFEIVYKRIKLAITEAMLVARFGNVEVQLANIPGYLSEAWRDKAITRLNEELVKEFGIKKVYFQPRDLEAHEEPAFIIVG